MDVVVRTDALPSLPTTLILYQIANFFVDHLYGRASAKHKGWLTAVQLDGQDNEILMQGTSGDHDGVDVAAIIQGSIKTRPPPCRGVLATKGKKRSLSARRGNDVGVPQG